MNKQIVNIISKYKTHIEIKYHSLLILGYNYHPNNQDGFRHMFECQCDCGNIVEIRCSKLLTNQNKSCGCNITRLASAIDIHKLNINKQIDFLTIIDVVVDINRKTDRIQYLCKCRCGNINNYNTTHIFNGYFKSCGCVTKQILDAIETHKSNIGKRCGLLTIINYKYYPEKHESIRHQYVYKCDCGNVIEARVSYFNRLKLCTCNRVDQYSVIDRLTTFLEYNHVVICDKYTTIQENGIYKKYTFECTICNHKFKSTLRDNKIVCCPICNPKRIFNSNIEAMFYNWISTLELDFDIRCNINPEGFI